jgi:RNA polymerase sigma factor (TIGR02999 family)
MDATPDINDLLLEARRGDSGAEGRLEPIVYQNLREIAQQRLRRFRPGDTLNTTALVHEVYLKLVDQTRADWQDQAHFFATASRAMRFILIDYARARTAARRGGRQANLHLDGLELAADERAVDLIELDEALTKLATFDVRLGRVVELRFFAGMNYDEIAEVTKLSVPTVKRDWQRARVWLYQMMRESDSPR